jgi:hypothetical protein
MLYKGDKSRTLDHRILSLHDNSACLLQYVLVRTKMTIAAAKLHERGRGILLQIPLICMICVPTYNRDREKKNQKKDDCDCDCKLQINQQLTSASLMMITSEPATKTGLSCVGASDTDVVKTTGS